MYGLVLAAALTAGTTAPDLGFGFHRWHGYPYPPVAVVPVAYYPFGAWYGPRWVQPYPPYWGSDWFAPAFSTYWSNPWYAPPAFAWQAPAACPPQRYSVPVGSEEEAGMGSEPPLAGSAKEQASVMVQAPLDVQLAFNGVRVERSAERETFTTPALEPGRPFHYKLAVVAVRGGKTVREERIVVVRAGKRTVVDLNVAE